MSSESLIGSHTKSVVDGFPVLIKFFHNSIIVSDTLESTLLIASTYDKIF